MKKNAITIEKRYLLFRKETKNILRKIQSKKAKSISLDFSKVNFMSRSFIDELLNVISAPQNKKLTIRIINLNPRLKKFLTQVKQRKKTIQKEIAISTSSR